MSLPAPLAQVLSRRLSDPLQDPASLREQVERHRAEAGRVYAHEPLFNLELANELADACNALLDEWPDLSVDQRALAQSACLWFVETDDEDDDFASLTGLDDDALVLNHVATALGRRDLLIKLDG